LRYWFRFVEPERSRLEARQIAAFRRSAGERVIAPRRVLDVLR
jgi:hypothetical protein